ncbi:amidohydrolase [Seongchinamella unica]|uniref:Omega-amidase YafV n=1 Tax=Seongchinamella unica TaxID=2547392 RepID=A0A4R5LU54_9GAMM|nr:amidohydrolase [Seongchinamella unica]TDG14837.1 amidohydrolase [Seongchinamella unica]
MRDLRVTLVQRELQWEVPAENRRAITQLAAGLAGKTDLLVLPEMFTTGFSMNALANAEEPGGATEQWMQALAAELDCAVTGSIAVRVGDDVFNRMLFASAAQVQFYDKRHLFRMAGEHKRYRGGEKRVIVNWRGWRLLLQVCYDLRFPVFSRNRQDYDLALYVANWPGARTMHWRQLLIARAIENQACVVGVNRVGRDANGLDYNGDSLAVSADGQLLADLETGSEARTVTLSGSRLQEYREKFPAYMDADNFTVDN